MNHGEVRERLGPYGEGDLPLDVRALVDAHLDTCAECVRELRELRKTVDLLRALPEPEPPSGVADAVMRRLAEGEGRAGPGARLAARLEPWLRPARLAPVALLAGAAAAFLALRLGALPPVPAPALPALREPAGAHALDDEPPPDDAAAPRSPGSPLLAGPARGAVASEVSLTDLDDAVGRAIATPVQFLDELDGLPVDARDAWLDRLAERAAAEARAFEVAQALRASADPRAEASAARFEGAAAAPHP